MNAKNIDDTFKTVCTQLRTAAQRIRGFDDRHNLALLTRAAICIYIAEMLANGFRIGTSPDTASYYRVGARLFEGEIDFIRTPVMPAVCHTARLLLGEWNPYGISVFLFAIFLVSAIYFYKTTTYITDKPQVRLISTALYACNPAVISWCIEDIGTESLALSGVVFLCFLTCKSIYTKPTPHPFIPDLRPYVPAHHAPPVLYLFRPGRPPVFRLIMERPTRQCRYKMDYIRLPGDHLCPHSPLLLGHPTTIRTVHPLASFLRQPYHHGSSGRARPRATDVGSHGRLCGISGKHRP